MILKAHLVILLWFVFVLSLPCH